MLVEKMKRLCSYPKLVFWISYITLVICLATVLPVKQEKQKIQTKESTIALIHKFEGSSQTAYQDSEGNWTIGVGHLIKETEAHLYWATLKTHEVQHLLKRDLKPCERFLTTDLGQPLNQNQFDALMSLCFNIGVDKFVTSNVVFDIRRNQFHSAANSFLNWNRPAILENRRRQERKLFLTDI